MNSTSELEKVTTARLIVWYSQLTKMCDKLDHGNLWSNLNHVRTKVDKEMEARRR